MMREMQQEAKAAASGAPPEASPPSRAPPIPSASTVALRRMDFHAFYGQKGFRVAIHVLGGLDFLGQLQRWTGLMRRAGTRTRGCPSG